VGVLGKDNIILMDRGTRGKRVDYTKVGLGNDSGFELEAGEEVSKEKKGDPAGPWIRSPQRKLAVDIEEDNNNDDDDKVGEYEEDEDEEE
jgi:hypothetical protein